MMQVPRDFFAAFHTRTLLQLFGEVYAGMKPWCLPWLADGLKLIGPFSSPPTSY